MKKYLLAASLCISLLLNHNVWAESPEIEKNAICDDMSQIPAQYDPTTTKFIFSVTCTPDKGIYKIEISGGPQTDAEKKTGVMDTARCNALKHGKNYGIFYNGEYVPDVKLDNRCKLPDDYEVHTIIDMEKPRMYDKAGNQSTMLDNDPKPGYANNMIGRFLYNLSAQKEEMKLPGQYPYSATFELNKNKRKIVSIDHLEGRGERSRNSHGGWIIDISKKEVKKCSHPGICETIDFKF